MPNLDAIKPGYRPKTTPAYNFVPKPPAKRRRKWIWISIIAIIIIGALGVGANILIRTNKIFTKKESIISRISGLFLSSSKPLIGEDQGTINILLMGVGGQGHDGPELTDTMIVASINVKTNEITLISIPRDFEYIEPGGGVNKINSVYAFAYNNDPDAAGQAAIQAVENLTGMTIPYFATVDFAGFVKAVNDVGGVDVTVDRTFTDSEFPNDYPYDTKGYIAPVTFTAGPAHFNGQQALIFARSRHSDNPIEGSDFARSERQKKIIVAMRDKVVSLKLDNLTTINNLLSDFTDNFRTNLEPYELKELADIGTKISPDNFYSFALDPDGVLVCSALVDPNTGLPTPAPQAPAPTDTTISGSATSSTSSSAANSSGSSTTPAPTAPVDNRIYVVLPCAGKTIADIRQYMIDAPLLAKIKKEGATIEVQNSTGKTYVTDAWSNLSNLGVNVKFKAFPGKVPYDQTILYDNSQGSKPNTLNYLKNNFTFTTSDIGDPSSSADFVIVIGKDEL